MSVFLPGHPYWLSYNWVVSKVQKLVSILKTGSEKGEQLWEAQVGPPTLRVPVYTMQSRIRVHRALKGREGKNKAPGLETQGMLWGQCCMAGKPVFKTKAHLDTTKCPL